MHPYGSPGVSQSPKSYNSMIEVFKFIRYVERNEIFTPISVKSLHRV